ncbi:MAG TPA: hypothetical protein VGH32_10295 [Pirellulales bacterium]
MMAAHVVFVLMFLHENGFVKRLPVDEFGIEVVGLAVGGHRRDFPSWHRNNLAQCNTVEGVCENDFGARSRDALDRFHCSFIMDEFFHCCDSIWF